MKTEVAQKEENKAEKKDWKQNNRLEIWLSTSKRISKNRKKIKDLEVQNCTRAIVHGRKKPDNDISKQKNSKISIIRLKTEKNAGLSFLLK
jgi:ATP-binding cassette subfamily F protein uup